VRVAYAMLKSEGWKIYFARFSITCRMRCWLRPGWESSSCAFVACRSRSLFSKPAKTWSVVVVGVTASVSAA